MKSYSVNLGTSLATYGSQGQLVSSTRPIGFTDSVSAPISNKGNFVLPTAWNYTVQSYYYMHGKFLMTGLPPFPGTVSSAEGNLGPLAPLPVRDNQDAVYNLALDRLNQKVRGGLDLSVALGEAGTTYRMLKSTAAVLSHARRLKPPGGFGSTRDVANGYLQFKYGWQPLMSDVFNAANESIRVVMNNIARYKGSAKIREGRGSTVIYSSLYGLSNVPVNRETGGASFSACTIGLTLEIPTSAFRLDRWMSLNPVSIGWELLPYSFVVDWFVDVGSYLRNLETACLYSMTFRSGYVSELWCVEGTDTCHSFKQVAPPYMKELIGVTGDFKYKTFNRRTLGTYPFPRRPTLRVDLSSGQLLSAAALLRQLLSK